jgi:hypothetical protein
MNPRRFRVGLSGARFGQTEDAATVVDENQIRQSTFDPSMLPNVPDNAPIDPVTGLATVTVTGTPTATPIWPLLIALAVIGYVLFSAGGHKSA